MKVAIIGAGSSYTPELLEGLIQKEKGLGLDEVVMEDVDAQRLDIIYDFALRMVKGYGGHFRVKKTLSFDEAIEGANFVVIQIRVGGQQGRHEDIMLGLRHDLIGQETTGVGGFAKALRTVPVVVDMANRIAKRTPDSWIINFTNPSGLVTEAILRFSEAKAVGLCNIPIDTQIEIAKALGVDIDKVELDYIGLNHLSWVRSIVVDGKEVIDQVIGALAKGWGPSNVPEAKYSELFWEALRMIPSPYLRYFYLTEEMLQKLKAKSKTRAQEVMDIEKRLFDYYSQKDTWKKPELLNERGGAWYSKIAVEVIDALSKDEPKKIIVNTLVGNAVGCMPDDAVMELPCYLSKKGVQPIPLKRPIEEEISGLIRQVKSYERLTIEAALKRSRKKALMALMANPLVRTLPKAEAVLNDLISSGRFKPVD